VPICDPRITIRVATTEDVPAIAEVHLTSWRAAYTAITPPGFMDTVTLESRLVRWDATFTGPAASATTTTLAVDGDAVLGICSFGPRGTPKSPGAGEIYSLHIGPSSWRQGIGRVLLDDALSRLATLGFDSADLWVLSDNGNARAFYEARGWSLNGEDRMDERSGFAIPEVRYSIALR
jgi:ribosomal protein S18 acetylase RimI-like enzyme